MIPSVSLGLLLLGMFASTAFGQPARCCFDKEFSVTIGTVGEVLAGDPDSAHFIDATVELGYDYYRDREGLVVHTRKTDGTYTTRYQLKDYATRRAYVSVDNSSCISSPLHSWDNIREPCIPADARFLSSSKFGYGANTLNVNTWTFTRAFSAVNDSMVTLSVSQNHCVPITENVIGPFGDNLTPVEQSLFFVDYHPGLENVANLEPPANCQPAP